MNLTIAPRQAVQDVPDLALAHTEQRSNLALLHCGEKFPDFGHVFLAEFRALSSSHVDDMGDGFEMSGVYARSVLADDVVEFHPFGDGSSFALPVDDMGVPAPTVDLHSTVAEFVSRQLPFPTRLVVAAMNNDVVRTRTAALVSGEESNGASGNKTRAGLSRNWRGMTATAHAQAGRIWTFGGILGKRHLLTSSVGRWVRRAGDCQVARLFVSSILPQMTGRSVERMA
jgi:hypothetical protein